MLFSRVNHLAENRPSLLPPTVRTGAEPEKTRENGSGLIQSLFRHRGLGKHEGIQRAASKLLETGASPGGRAGAPTARHDCRFNHRYPDQHSQQAPPLIFSLTPTFASRVTPVCLKPGSTSALSLLRVGQNGPHGRVSRSAHSREPRAELEQYELAPSRDCRGSLPVGSSLLTGFKPSAGKLGERPHEECSTQHLSHYGNRTE